MSRPPVIRTKQEVKAKLTLLEVSVVIVSQYDVKNFVVITCCWDTWLTPVVTF